MKTKNEVYFDHNDSEDAQKEQLVNHVTEKLLAALPKRFFTLEIRGSFDKGKQKLCIGETHSDVMYIKSENN